MNFDAISRWFLDFGSILITVAVAVGLALLVHLIIFRMLRRFSKRSEYLPDGVINKHCRRAGRWLMVVAAIFFVLDQFEPIGPISKAAQHGLTLALIFCIAWLINRFVWVFEDIVFARFDIDVKDNLQARKVHTQLNVMRRVMTVIIVILAAGAMLMTFDGVEQLGRGLLASAGIAGIVIGFAAQRTLGTFVAGLQIAFTQPIRVNDVVIVEGEWGKIEEITLTYVVIGIWDMRRLVVPITYFIERPFQNWTRVTADLLGTVFIYMDYTVPVEAVREELTRLLQGHELWDGKVNSVQVTNATERTMEVRLLVSAAGSGQAWDLRCYLREKMIDFLQRNYRQSLPRVRAEIGGELSDISTDKR